MVASKPPFEKTTDKVRDRNAIPAGDRWNVEALYDSWVDWEKDLEKWVRPLHTPHWPELEVYQGHLAEPQKLKELMDKTKTEGGDKGPVIADMKKEVEELEMWFTENNIQDLPKIGKSGKGKTPATIKIDGAAKLPLGQFIDVVQSNFY